MPLRLLELSAAGQVAQHGQAGGGLDLGLAELQVPVAGDSVEDDPGHVQGRVELLVAQHLGGHAARDLGCVGYQYDRSANQLCQLGG